MIRRKVQVNGSEIEVQQDLAFGHAGSVWDGALVLIHYLNKNSQHFRKQFQNKSIIDLGAGTGALGLAVGCFKPKTVVMTDFKENLPLIVRNIDINFPNNETVLAEELSWGDVISMERLQQKYKPDFLIGSQLVYDKHNTQLLLQTLDYYKEHNPLLSTIISYQDNQKKQINLEHLLKTNNYKYQKVTWSAMDPDFRDDFIRILIIQGRLKSD